MEIIRKLNRRDIARSDIGVVTFFNIKKGYGFVKLKYKRRAQAQRDIYFTFKEIDTFANFKSLLRGDVVDIKFDEQGKITQIKKI